MKKLLTLFFIAGTYLCPAQQALYDVTAGDGNGIRFWQDNQYKIHMGNSAEYHYGPVSDYSIKMNMSNTPGRGWTWGYPGSTPVAAIGNQGNMQIAGWLWSGRVIATGSASTEEVIFNASNLSDQDFNVRVSGVGAPITRTIIGPSTLGRFSLGVGIGGGNEYLTILNGGKIGIGTTSPMQRMHISASNAHSEVAARIENTDTNNDSFAPIQFKTGSSPNVWQTFARNGDMFSGIANVADYMVIKDGGNVGIGTSSPDAKLAVSGQVHAQEVKVSVTVPGPDYVFEKNYKLTPLEEIKNYIDQNKHLPEVPSAKEMEKNGVQLGEMNMLLLKKIEELTLHLIEQNKLISEQNERIVALENKK